MPNDKGYPKKERLSTVAALRVELLKSQDDQSFEQKGVAEFFDVSRQTFNSWENGKQVPPKKHRSRFIVYLWDKLELRREPDKFDPIWKILQEEWGWEPVDDEEWFNISKEEYSRRRQLKSPVGSPSLHIAPPDSLPDISDFVGRQTDLERYLQQFEQTGVAIITGLPGVGKSWFATKLAIEVGARKRIFRHVCHQDAGIDTIIWRLAEFLAWYGNDTILRELHISVRGGELRKTLLDSLFHLLSGHDYLIYLDDFHNLLNDAKKYHDFATYLQGRIEKRKIGLIVTAQSQYQLGIGSGNEIDPLRGLSLVDTRHLLERKNLKFKESLVADLYRYTEGNANLLTLAINVLQQNPDLKQLVDSLSKMEIEQVENFILREVHEQLDPDQQLAMQGVAVLLGYPGSADAIEEVLDGKKIRSQLTYLAKRYLLETAKGKQAQEYDAHEIVRIFYYKLLGRRERIAMHLRAGDYYEHIEPDIFKAALHYHEGGANQKAVELILPEVRIQLHQGQAIVLRKIYESASAVATVDVSAARIKLAAGDIFAYLQEPKPAQENYAAAVTILKSLPTSPVTYDLLISAYRGLGVFLRRREPTQALIWLQEGLNVAIAAGNQTAQADFWVQIGIVQTGLGNMEVAKEALEHGLQLAPSEPHRVRLLALLNLGYYYYYQNQLAVSTNYMTQALTIAQELRDTFNELSIHTNLAAIKQTTGDWAGAKVSGDEAIRLAQQVGNQAEEIKARLNEAVLTLRQEGLEKGAEQLRATLESAQRAEFPDVIISAHSYLAEYHLRRADATAALTALATAEALAKARERNYLLPFVNYLYAEYYLFQKDYKQARFYAEQAIAIAQPMGMGQEEGQGLRALGQVQMSTQQPTEAEASFKESLELLSQNPYETARTQVAWGSSLLEFGDQTGGRELVEQAILEFQRLGARHDQLETEKKFQK